MCAFCLLSGTSLLSTAPSPRIIAQEKIRQEFLKIQTAAKANKASFQTLRKEVTYLNLQVTLFTLGNVTPLVSRIVENNTQTREKWFMFKKQTQ